ncbi:sensor domain-containing diguanylate cyclase [Chitinolyticbacter meiyuanensis]|uniref:sensor domain-containing diguanylate cyclase n=1 Tax=Chitinolyticbacter meiyuanensis TaxID=682798 RepID=UPI0011E5AE80|nr:diguanylate cyclase [Chitinolyticbacter meiyuanensis]
MAWSARQSTSITLFMMLFGLGMLAILGFQVSSSYQAEMARVRNQTDNQAQLLALTLSGTLRELDLVLRDLADRIDPATLGGATEIEALLSDKLRQLPQADALQLVDASGQIVSQASGKTLPQLPEGLVKALAGAQFRERLYTHIDGNNGLLLARRLDAEDGSVAAVIIARLPASYLNRELARVDTEPHGIAQLLDRSGQRIASHGSATTVLTADRSLIEQLYTGKNADGAAQAQRTGGNTLLASYRQVGASALFIVVGASSLDYLARWRTNTLYFLLGGGMLLVMALTMMYFFWRSHRLARNLKQKEARLNISESRFRQMIETIPVALILAREPEHLITYINQQGARTFNIPQAGALSLRAFDFYASNEDFSEQLKAVREAQGIRNVEVRLRRWSGETFWASLSMSSVEVGEERTLMIGVSDITERKRLELELKRRATTDGLSGLANRAHFMEVANQELLRAQRFNRPLALLMVDIDHFKRINDTYGHDVGDMAIKAVAKIAQSALRDVDLVARMGGEEFAALLPETTPDLARAVAERLRQRIEGNVVKLENGTEVRFTGSIGISALRPADHLVDDLLKRADLALYHSKHHGRNQVSVHDEIDVAS